MLRFRYIGRKVVRSVSLSLEKLEMDKFEAINPSLLKSGKEKTNVGVGPQAVSARTIK